MLEHRPVLLLYKVTSIHIHLSGLTVHEDLEVSLAVSCVSPHSCSANLEKQNFRYEVMAGRLYLAKGFETIRATPI